MSFEQAREEELAKVPWLYGRTGRAYVKALGRAYDVELLGLKFAVKQLFPTTCGDEALDDLGPSYALERFDVESYAHFRARMLDAFPTWRFCGRPKAVIDVLHDFGIHDVEVYENRT